MPTADTPNVVVRSQGSVPAMRGGGAHSIAGPVVSNDQEGV